jgi:hypothetical protein
VKRFSISFLALALLVFGAEPDPWINAPPAKLPLAEEAKLPATDLFEVVASMNGNAQFDLQKKSFIALSEAAARKLTGHYYSCPRGKRPYLVRAVAGFAGTGKFHVYRIEQAVLISHESLGRGWATSRTALVLNLDFEPNAAYATVSIIE